MGSNKGSKAIFGFNPTLLFEKCLVSKDKGDSELPWGRDGVQWRKTTAGLKDGLFPRKFSSELS